MIWLFLIALAVVLLILIWFLQRYFAKATLDSAIVRTGLGGMRVVLNGGCLALPIVHQTQRVHLGAMSLNIDRKAKSALLTGDQLRADISMEFELKVAPTEVGVATAAQALGSSISRNPEAIAELLDGSLIDAMQNAAARRTLTDLHHDRAAFTKQVQAEIEAKAEQFGLLLISASLLHVDQSDLTQLDENNAFNAVGLRRLAELVSEQRQQRTDTETASEIAVRESQLKKQKRVLEIQQAEREAAIAHDESVDRIGSESRAKIEKFKSKFTLETESARIETEQKIQIAKTANDETVRHAELRAIQALEQAKIENQMELAKLRASEFEVQALEEKARVDVVLAAEFVQTQKDIAVAEREHKTEQLRLQKQVDLSLVQAKSDADVRAIATASEVAASDKQAKADLIVAQAAAAGRVAMIEAENVTSDAIIKMRLEERKLDRMPEIMTQMMKPVEKIESIKINHIGGMGGSSNGNPDAGADGAFGSAMDQILGMAVRLPAMKQMGEEIGLEFDANLAGRTADYANRTKPKEEPKKK